MSKNLFLVEATFRYNTWFWFEQRYSFQQKIILNWKNAGISKSVNGLVVECIYFGDSAIEICLRTWQLLKLLPMQPKVFFLFVSAINFQGNFFIEYANVLFFFQTKLFQNFVKLLSKIITHLCHCSFRFQITSGENITRDNPMKSLSSFFMYGAIPSFHLVESPFIFYFLKEYIRQILLRYRKLFS